MVYLWTIPNEYPDDLIGEYDRASSPDRFLLSQGTPVQLNSELHLHFDAQSSDLRELDDLANNAMVPLVSPRVAQVLTRLASDQVQLVPARVTSRDDELVDYGIVVATKLVQGIDHGSSEYDLIPGTKAIMGFNKLRYRKECLGTLHIARDAEYPSNLLVSDVLRDALEALNPRQLALYRPEELFG